MHPFGDPSITDDFEHVSLPLDAHEFHDYAAEWTPEQVCFFVDEELVREVAQSPAYPMQLMLNIYEFADDPAIASTADSYPKSSWWTGSAAIGASRLEINARQMSTPLQPRSGQRVDKLLDGSR